MRSTVAFGILLCLFADFSSCSPVDKVKLRDLQVLTFRQGEDRTSRRSQTAPQLKCRGGSAGCEDQPSLVECYNRGKEGGDVQWECKAEMKRAQKFGSVHVTCEGYDHSPDEYILVGSCGLEYYLERTGYNEDSSLGTNVQQRRKRYHHSHTPLWSLLDVIFVVLAAVGFCCSCLFCIFLCIGDILRVGPTCHDRQGFSCRDVGYQPLISQYTPATYYRQHCSTRQYPCTNYDWFPGIWPRSSSGGPGFWTGAATGGLLGYLYGNRGTDAYERHVDAVPVERTFLPAAYFANDVSNDGWSSTDVGDALDDVITSTGFGGTDRR